MIQYVERIETDLNSLGFNNLLDVVVGIRIGSLLLEKSF